MTGTETRRPSTDAYASVRQLIFSGELQPGQWIPPAMLSTRLDVSKTVVREVLSTLAGERLVTSHPGKGFKVFEADPTTLPTITELRCLLEERALRRSIEFGDVYWESQIVATHHRLARAVRHVADDETTGDARLNEEWASAHTEFHGSLLSACGEPLLLDLCSQTAAMFEVCRIRVAVRGPVRDVTGEHQAILDATLARDPDLAAELLTAHYRITCSDLLERWDVASLDRST